MLDKTVVRAWLLFLGPLRIDWLDAWFNGLDRLSLIQEFCGGGRRSCCKTFVIAGRGLGVEDVDRVHQSVQENDPFSFYWCLGQAYEKRPSSVLDFVKGFVDDPSLFDSLDWAIKLFPGIPMKTLISVAAVQLLCLKSYPQPYNFTSNYEEHVLIRGLKANRLYKITEEMLPSCIKRATQADALNKSHMDIMLSGCKFWREKAAAVVDDATLESTVDELFPDDSPDEWSLKDRSVSHPVTFKKYKLFIKTEYRASLLWGFRPALRTEWAGRIDGFLKTCYAPER